jgi:hypothetical protein
MATVVSDGNLKQTADASGKTMPQESSSSYYEQLQKVNGQLLPVKRCEHCGQTVANND